jgi:hypothetical protein
LPDVDLAYKTVRYFDNRGEGKPEARANFDDPPPAPRDRPALLPKA